MIYLKDMEKDPTVVTELEVLRQRRHELEARLSELQVYNLFIIHL